MPKAKRLEKHEEEGGLLTLIGKLVTNIFALLVVEYLVPGFEFTDLRAVVVAAIVIGVVNTFIRPIVQLIALPISILTLGIAAFFVNVLLLMLSAAIVPGFEIDSFLTATVSSLLLTLVITFLHRLTKSK